MAGINAASVSTTHTATGVDVSATGFLVGERIALSTTPTGSGYQWSMAQPSDSAPARSALDDNTDGGPAFIPDVAGYYVVSVVVDGATTYVIRLAVLPPAIQRLAEGTHYLPLTDAQVPTPQTGFVLFCGSEHSNLPCIKKSDDTVHTVDLTAT